jgi:hypothetical protein
MAARQRSCAVVLSASLDSDEKQKEDKKRMGTWVGPTRGMRRAYEAEEGNTAIVWVFANVLLPGSARNQAQ